MTEYARLCFARLNAKAIVPTKRDEDGGYDIYANFEEDYIRIDPQTVRMIPTGIASAFPPSYRMVLKERGSSGSKGLAIRCGVIDSGYRDEWFICLNNTINKPIFISKISEQELLEKTGFQADEIVYYPCQKAIAQALLEETPKIDTILIPYKTLCKINSRRGIGKLGSTNK